MSTLNLYAASKLADVAPKEYAEVLRTAIPKVEQYPDDGVHMAEEVIPILQVLIELKDTPECTDLVNECWEEIFKGGAAFNKNHIEQNMAPRNPLFMKYLDIALYSANPELGHKVGITEIPKYDPI